MRKSTSGSSKSKRAHGLAADRHMPGDDVPKIRRRAKKEADRHGNLGSLIIIGGKEDRERHMNILSEVRKRAGDGKLVVATAATSIPKECWDDYRQIFKRMGVKKIEHLLIEKPNDARCEAALDVLDGATCVFFTGGDQLRITTKIGGTPIAARLFEIYAKGGTIAGTSAGASMMGELMLVGAETQESHKVGHHMLAAGMGLLKETIIDQHFAQRGRIGRLLGAISMNPGLLGIGVDEDTALVAEADHFEVVGTNAVYVIDGREVSYTNISEEEAERTMSVHDVKLHILSSGQIFDAETRRPKIHQDHQDQRSGQKHDRSSNEATH